MLHDVQGSLIAGSPLASIEVFESAMKLGFQAFWRSWVDVMYLARVRFQIEKLKLLCGLGKIPVTPIREL